VSNKKHKKNIPIQQAEEKIKQEHNNINTASFTLEQKEHFHAQLSFLYSRNSTRLLLLFTLLIIIDFIRIAKTMPENLSAFNFFVLFVVVFMPFVGLPLILKKQTKRLLTGDPFWSQEIRYTFNDRGIWLRNKKQLHYDWKDLQSIKEIKDGFLLVVDKRNFVFLPFRALQEAQIALLRKAWSAVVPKYKLSLKKTGVMSCPREE